MSNKSTEDLIKAVNNSDEEVNITEIPSNFLEVEFDYNNEIMEIVKSIKGKFLIIFKFQMLLSLEKFKLN